MNELLSFVATADADADAVSGWVVLFRVWCSNQVNLGMCELSVKHSRKMISVKQLT